MPELVEPTDEMMDATAAPPMIYARADFAGSDGGAHSLVVWFDSAVPTGVELNLKADPVVVGLVFDGKSTPGDESMAFVAVSGTISFEHACGAGVSASISGAVMVESYSDYLQPVQDGCEITVDTAVEIGDPCEPFADAGPGDGG